MLKASLGYSVTLCLDFKVGKGPGSVGKVEAKFRSAASCKKLSKPSHD